MQTSLNRRFKKGLLLGITHTWSKALGTQAVDLPGINGFGARRASTRSWIFAHYRPILRAISGGHTIREHAKVFVLAAPLIFPSRVLR
jgi:hypothetical protein